MKKETSVKNEMQLESMSFEQAAKELETIVEKLNSGSVPLDEMISLYERGVSISEYCGKLLNEYDGRIEKAVKGEA